MTLRSLALLAALTLLVMPGCGKGGSAKAQGPAPLAVAVGKAARQDIGTYIQLDGQITPLQTSTLSLPQSGTVVSIYANEGDHVSAGEVLAKLDDSTLRAQLAANQAAVAQAQANVTGSALTVPITSQQVSGNVVSAQQTLAQAQNTLVSAKAAYDTAATQFHSNQMLANQGYVARTTLDQSRSAFVAAEQQLNNARAGVAAAQASLQTAKGNVGQTAVQQQDVQQKQAALESAQANVHLLQTQIGQTTLTAPYGGVITQRLVDPGALASPNQPILQISQIDTVWVNANVPDDSLPYVHRGTQVTFTTPSVPGRTFTGAIFDVNAVPTQGTLSYRARIREPNPDERLRGGMLVTLSVRKEYHKNAIVVPRTAVFTAENGTSVYTVEDGKAKAVPVIVGLQTDTLTEVRAPGIVPGTVVITTRPDALQDGSVVAIAGSGGSGPAPGAGAKSPSGSSTSAPK
ncbi:MAG: efflux RND transporter periplasmic adaptor subunit [Candidatus Eremiobacteraeota bacterium]|nr:efflux RND transporter periplasmic adaptor subunit [Candidatus Eremiobacteraeota bacterium]MBV9648438.1 efflux RND transporter periplasmic adaptor subunit [Candidatus Eremiobacteraeota bacterium]